MSSKNKFGFDGLAPKEELKPQARTLGPMGAAVREAAGSLQEATDTKVEQRRQNASDAKEYRAAVNNGRVLVNLGLDTIQTSALPRDRLDLEDVAKSEEMEELMASIEARGQREPIEVFRDNDGVYQLKKGWRRWTALRQLYAKTGNDAFATIIARVAVTDEDRVALYIDMVEENIIREDLTFAEMAQLALTAAADDVLGLDGADAAVARLYASLHKMKRSYVRSFVFLLEQLGSSLQWPRAVSRNLGVDVVRSLRADTSRLAILKAGLDACDTEAEQATILAGFVASGAGDKPAKQRIAPKQKFEFHVGEAKVTARNGEFRIVAQRDYTSVPREVLERAVRAFQDALK